MASSTLFSMCSSKRGSFDIKAINSNKAKWRQSERLLRNRMQCHVVEVEKMPAYTMGNKVHLDDVIEAQQFDRETLNAIFKVAKEMETIEK
ncbi:hypothetical protein HRI_001394600 [Hibiscus trionum]|uniref:Uncharacterized protein n=1 Tax=Hibiscus trionum TaxID=183268 RepID=A0A9W7LUN1_HIBTR|nr:hypothetical protein HRI_001394600 [Hibiscus trionum]